MDASVMYRGLLHDGFKGLLYSYSPILNINGFRTIKNECCTWNWYKIYKEGESA